MLHLPARPRALKAQAAHLLGTDGALVASGALIVLDGELPEIVTFEGDVFTRSSFGLNVEICRLVRPFRADVLFQAARPA